MELGDSEVGFMIRIDNVLQGFETHREKLVKKLDDMVQRQVALREELKKKEDYSDQISACKDKLKKIDKKLGVDK